MINLIEISDVASKLGYDGKRGVISWCSKNKVGVFHIGRKFYLIKEEFEIAFYRPFLLYQQYNNAEKSRKNNYRRIYTKIDYVPKNEYEKRFLEKLSRELTKISFRK